MSFFDDLQRFAEGVEKFFEGKPKPVNLRSCKNCPYCKRGYCTQSSPPTKILSEYYAQGCIYYGAEEVVTGLVSKEEKDAGYKSLLDRIKKVDLVDLITKISEITTVKTLQTLSEITNIKNLESLDAVDYISTVSAINTIYSILNITSVDLIDNITNVGTLNLLNTVNLIKSISSIDAITNILNVDSVDLIDAITTISNILNIDSIDLIDRITKVDEITKIGEITTIRDLTWSPRSLIQNPSFEQDEVGWVLTLIGEGGSISIDSDVYRYGKKSLKIVTAGAGAGMASQHFPVPIKTDWFTSLDLYLRASVVSDTIVKLIWVHTDELTTTNTLGVTQEDIFQRKVVTPPADKYIERIYFITTDTVDCTCYIDGLMVIF